MADLSSIFSSLFRKIKPKAPPEPAEVSPPHPRAERAAPASDLISEERLRSLDAAQLGDFISRQPERAVVRILGSLKDLDAQLRVVQCIGDESTLKRVVRSQLDKKIRRAAEKKLRVTGASGLELRLRGLAPLNERMRSFLGSPRWSEAAELRSEVFDPGLLDGIADGFGGKDSKSAEGNALLAEFQSLRERLWRQIEAYDQACAEMEGICQRLDPSRSVSKAEAKRLQERWDELAEKYAFPKEFEAVNKYEEILAARKAPRAVLNAPATDTSVPSLDTDQAQRKEKEHKEKKEQQEQKEQKELAQKAERQARLGALDALLVRLREIQAAPDNLVHRQAGPALREMQNEIAALRRWRREFPAQLDEAEGLVKALSSKRTEAVDEARWDAWARTDLAIRIQTQLEQMISGLETEPDPAVALRNSVGLTARLHEYAQEMRSLGSLERGKDHKIWQQFKSLSDRGWAVCERMRGLVLEQVKSLLSEHASQPIDFSPEALAGPREPASFKASAFEGNIPDRFKELRVMWLEIGTKGSQANRELEAAFSRLFEAYSRQRNLQLGQRQRAEANLAQGKRDILKEMKAATEGKATLLSRAQVAKRLEDRWKKAPMPDSIAADLQAEFEGYQRALAAELVAESEKSSTLVAAIQARAQEVLDRIQARNGASLTQAQKALTGLEAELAAIEKAHAQLEGLRPIGLDLAIAGVDGENAGKRFHAQLGQVRGVIQESKAVASREVEARAQERDRILREAEALALSTDWEASRARFVELRELWAKAGAVGHGQDAAFGSLFDNIEAFFGARFEGRERSLAPDQLAKHRKARADLLYSLEALTRLRATQAGETAEKTSLPFGEEELRANASGRLLELGMRYRQILALDPAAGRVKETRKIMEQWSKTAAVEADLPAAEWDYYLDRVRWLLEIKQERG